MDQKTVALRYLEFLEKGETEAVIALFAPDGIVESPLYGHLPAKDFYQLLAADTRSSKLHLDGLFEEATSGRLALVFDYQWTLVSGKQIDFKVVDLLEFDPDFLITRLQIIYDTVAAVKGERFNGGRRTV